ncbi:hypothetical protein [Vagococcus silagei]|uniref:Uncharacterized protein n=1 Tax=Vagococcus silagei TaxID=2508885 RepID=A0A4V3TUS3_9ENTE|nr:hypothetical protein [Vagococcus silagei]THB60089.1 hypothetical protein ESZ54_12235 [Vagococcus silagei]
MAVVKVYDLIGVIFVALFLSILRLKVVLLSRRLKDGIYYNSKSLIVIVKGKEQVIDIDNIADLYFEVERVFNPFAIEENGKLDTPKIIQKSGKTIVIPYDTSASMQAKLIRSDTFF